MTRVVKNNTAARKINDMKPALKSTSSVESSYNTRSGSAKPVKNLNDAKNSSTRPKSYPVVKTTIKDSTKKSSIKTMKQSTRKNAGCHK